MVEFVDEYRLVKSCGAPRRDARKLCNNFRGGRIPLSPKIAQAVVTMGGMHFTALYHLCRTWRERYLVLRNLLQMVSSVRVGEMGMTVPPPYLSDLFGFLVPALEVTEGEAYFLALEYQISGHIQRLDEGAQTAAAKRERAFLKLLQQTNLVCLGSWLEQQGRSDDAVAARCAQLISGAVVYAVEALPQQFQVDLAVKSVTRLMQVLVDPIGIEAAVVMALQKQKDQAARRLQMIERLRPYKVDDLEVVEKHSQRFEVRDRVDGGLVADLFFEEEKQSWGYERGEFGAVGFNTREAAVQHIIDHPEGPTEENTVDEREVPQHLDDAAPPENDHAGEE